MNRAEITALITRSERVADDLPAGEARAIIAALIEAIRWLLTTHTEGAVRCP